MRAVSIFIFLLFNTSVCFCQDTVLNKYGLPVIKDKRTFIQSVKSDGRKKMADVKKLVPKVVLDLRYATGQNFMHEKFYYQTSTTYLRMQR